MAPKVRSYNGEGYGELMRRVRACPPRAPPGGIVFDPNRPQACDAPRNAADPMGSAGVLANDTAFINSNWTQVNRSANIKLAKYWYLESRLRHNGTVPRVYHENVIRNVRKGRTGRRHPFTQQPWTANMDKSVRRLQ